MARTLFRAPRRRNISTGVRNTLTIDMSTLDTRIYNSLVRPRFHMLIGGILASDRVIEALLYGMSAPDPVLALSQESPFPSRAVARRLSPAYRASRPMK